MARLLLSGLTLAALGTAPIVLGDPPVQPGADFMAIPIIDNADDGTEVNGSRWFADGYGKTGCNRMGRATAEAYDIGLRFQLPHVLPGETFAYARLALPGTSDGLVDARVALSLVGIDQDGVASFSVRRPSRLPKTDAFTRWDISSDWPAQGADCDFCRPLRRYTPNLAPFVNEIVGRATWGSGEYGKTLGIVIEENCPTGLNFLTIKDFADSLLEDPDLGGSGEFGVPVLELYRTLWSTFVAKPLLGRPTDRSVTVNAMSLLTLDVYLEYGTVPRVYPQRTPALRREGQVPFDIVVGGLAPSTSYYYRLRYRRPGDALFEKGPQARFRTQRRPDEAFRFTVASDSHIWEAVRQGANRELYRIAMTNVATDRPDFHIDLGDTFLCEDYGGGDARDFQEALIRHLAQRSFLDLACQSTALFLVLGNHEGEQGWRLDGTPDNVAVWAANARKLCYPNPVPDGFYSGCGEEIEFVGLPENYYAFEWGKALFVVLDPYWYTTTKPHDAGGIPGSGDNWDWTLGRAQYDWLRETLEGSDATFKFVFAHQVAGGADLYGRGGVEAASHALAGRGSFEWGGEDVDGAYIFDSVRPDWGVPVHQLLVDNQVDIFFRGHDHVFVKQELDGVVYQECPQPSDAMYGQGQFGYLYGDLVNSSGHLRVDVASGQVTVEYVRAFLPGTGENGRVDYRYTVPARP